MKPIKAIYALFLFTACLAAACAPETATQGPLDAAQPTEETSPPTLEELQAAMDGEQITFFSGFWDAEYPFVYAGESAPLGICARTDSAVAIGPREAAVSAAKLLVAAYGGTCLTAPYTTAYLDDGQSAPLYFVTVENTGDRGESYLVILDASSGQTRYFCRLCAPHAESGKLRLTAEETELLTTLDEWKAAATGAWMQRLLADEPVSSNVDWNAAAQPLTDSFQSAEPFLYASADVKCRMLLHMPSGDSYDVSWLADADDLSMGEDLLSAAVIPQGEWASYRADAWEDFVKTYLPAQTPWQAENRWVEALSTGASGAAFVNAEVTAWPDMPAITVQLEPEPFSEARTNAVVTGFAGDAAVYAYRSGKTEEAAAVQWRFDASGNRALCIWADLPDSADLLFTGESGPDGEQLTVAAMQPDNGAIATLLSHNYGDGDYIDRIATLFGLSNVSFADGAWLRDGREVYTPTYGGVPVLRAQGQGFLPNELWLERRGNLCIAAGLRRPCAYGVEMPLKVPLLSLAEVRQAVRVQAAAIADGAPAPFLRITALRQCYAPEYDAAAGTYRLIPAWNVYCYDANTNLDERLSEDVTHTLLLTLRASDGTPVAAAGE